MERRLSVLLATCQQADAAADPRPILALVTREVAALGTLIAPPRIVGESAKIQSVRRTIENIRASSASVLITGEAGTGKELVAATIHRTSLRARGPFIRLAERGEAADLREFFHRARGGSLYVAEVAGLGPSSQGQILRGLDDVETDVRLLAGTARDLDAEAARGAFRRDLYYRLRVIHIALPALREVTAEIPRLVKYFLERVAAEEGSAPVELPPPVIEQLARRRWPGNIAQLQAEVHRLAAGGTLRRAVAKLEKQIVGEALEAAHGNQRQAAKALGLSRQGLINKLKRYGMRRGPHSDLE